MDLRAMRHFLAVADAGSVTAAAGELHVTQPALSRSIRSLERQLGLTLFDRTGRRLTLTGAGRQLDPILRDVVHRADLAVRAALSIRAGGLPEITISCPGTTLTDVLAPFLATWSTDDPMPHVWEELPPTVYDSLRAGADLAIGTSPPPAVLSVHPVAVLPLWAYVPATHPLAGAGVVRLSQLRNEDLLVLPPEQHSRRAIDSAFRDQGLAPRSQTEFRTPEVAQAVAAAGRGVAIVSDDPRFGLTPLTITRHGGPVVVRLFAAWVPDHHAAAELEAVAHRLEAFCSERYGDVGDRVPTV
jgi:DNA-binding transcriptional LysR family regulator